MAEKNLTLPGNPRTQPRSLTDIFGYDHLYIPVGEVELATMEVLSEIGVIPSEDFSLLGEDTRSDILGILTTDVDVIERTLTRHDIRAWVRKAQEMLPPPLRRWLHVPLTSYDPIDTGRALQFFRAHTNVVQPKIRSVVRIFSHLISEHAGTLQIGRTHGQHALPITAGFWLATILSRILYNAESADRCVKKLRGKISGAVGAYNAQVGLGIETRSGNRTFEERVLQKLGLHKAPISTQIVPPEPLAYYLFSSVMLSAALGQFGRDCRQLMRTEIAEVAEEFEEGQVGSSSMAQKRNPVTFENLEGTWLRTKNEFGKVFDSLLSEHQRDLVGSSLMRDFPIIIVNLTHQIESLLRPNKKDVPFLARIRVDGSACRKNFAMSAPYVLAEPLYIALQMAGYERDAHELVNREAMPLTKEGLTLLGAVERIAENRSEVTRALQGIPAEIMNLLRNPEQYTGKAKEGALKVSAAGESYASGSEA